MSDVAILGAGELGGSIAHVLARRGIVGRVLVVDPAGQVAAGKALDIMQAGPVEGFGTRVDGSGDLSRIAGAAIVVVADSITPSDGDDLLVLRQITQLARQAVVICAGASHRTLVERGVRELGFDRRRLVGSAPEALAASVRAVVAAEIDGSVKDVALTVLGAPPAHTVVAWEDAAIGGFAATRVLDEPTRRRIAAHVPALWPPGPHVLAQAAADAVAAVLGISRRLMCCFLSPDDRNGRKERAVALAARLGPGGVVRIERPTLSASAQVALDNAMLL